MSVVHVPSPDGLRRILMVVALRVERLDPVTQERVRRLYAALRRDYRPTVAERDQRAAAMRFIDGLLAIPELRSEVEPHLQAVVGEGAPVAMRPLELPERLAELAPRAAAAAPPPAASPSAAAEPPAGPTRSLRGKKKQPKGAKKNGGGAPVAANGGGATRGAAREEDLAEAADGGPRAGRPPVTRYPELDVPARVALNARASVTFSLRLAPSDPTTATALSIDDTAEAPPVLELVIRAPGFEVEGSNTQEITVSRDHDVEARFVLRALREGPATIRVDIYQAGRRIGTVRGGTLVGGGAVAAAASVAADPIELVADPSAAPDLEICVEVDRQDDRRLHFTLHSTAESIDYHHTPMGSVKLLRSPLEEIQLVYAELSKMAGKAPKAEEIPAQRQRLAAIANELWERLFSEELKRSYWTWRDRVRSILITSDEPWIPWEIVKPYQFDERNARADEPHLCERFAVSRWLAGGGPADRIHVTSLQPVAPRTSNLAAVDSELKAFERLAQIRPGLTAQPRFAERAQLVDAFERGTFSVLHVASHGSFNAAAPDNSALTLSDGELRPSDIRARFGGDRRRPVVFINACHGGRLEHTFTGIGGWADRLVRQTNVAAFIGAAWEVNDRLALAFADRFYRALLAEGKTVGESFRLAREVIRDAEPSNSTWLAYVLYSDPMATVARAS